VSSVRRFKVVICRGPECGDRRGSAELYEAFHRELEACAVRDRVELVWQSCFGRCTQGPNVLVRERMEESPPVGAGLATLPGPRGATALYNHVDRARIARVVASHVCRGEIVREYVEPPGILRSEPVGSPQKDRLP
jgi:(2Fe-2S) ferredoxin